MPSSFQTEILKTSPGPILYPGATAGAADLDPDVAAGVAGSDGLTSLAGAHAPVKKDNTTKAVMKTVLRRANIDLISLYFSKIIDISKKLN
jgi:hypothetical protein